MARCTVRRLTGETGLKGAVRGRAARTTLSNVPAVCPTARVNRQHQTSRPNALWVCALTHLKTGRGFLYCAFVIGAYARRIVGWPVSSSLRTDLALDALRNALFGRQVGHQGGLVRQSERGVQHLSIRYTEQLPDAGVEPSVGKVSATYDRAFAETIIDLFRTEVIRRRAPWRNAEAVEFATAEGVD